MDKFEKPPSKGVIAWECRECQEDPCLLQVVKEAKISPCNCPFPDLGACHSPLAHWREVSND